MRIITTTIFIGLNIAKNCSHKPSLFCTMEHETSLEPVEVMSDTTGASDIIFGLFWLLDYQFSPRLADIGKARFWRMDPTADYGELNALARHRINITLIEQYWDKMLRVAGSLKLGTIKASELLRSLLRSQRPSTLAGVNNLV